MYSGHDRSASNTTAAEGPLSGLKVRSEYLREHGMSCIAPQGASVMGSCVRLASCYENVQHLCNALAHSLGCVCAGALVNSPGNTCAAPFTRAMKIANARITPLRSPYVAPISGPLLTSKSISQSLDDDVQQNRGHRQGRWAQEHPALQSRIPPLQAALHHLRQQALCASMADKHSAQLPGG
jgi:hypothetical protein